MKVSHRHENKLSSSHETHRRRALLTEERVEQPHICTVAPQINIPWSVESRSIPGTLQPINPSQPGQQIHVPSKYCT